MQRLSGTLLPYEFLRNHELGIHKNFIWYVSLLSTRVQYYDHNSFPWNKNHTSGMNDTNTDCEIKLPDKDQGASDVWYKRKYNHIERVLQCRWDSNNMPCTQMAFKEVWKTDPSTWLDLETSILSSLPVDIFRVHILPLLSSRDLTWFLLSLGFNQWTDGVGNSYRRYDSLGPLPKWLSDWLWDNREDTHTRAAHRLTGWENTSTWGDWVFVRNRLTFDGDDPPQVYKKRRIERGAGW